MAKVKAKSTVKKKKKIWLQINSPKLFGEKKLGETHVFELQKAVGKTVEHNLMNLTGDMKKQNITMKFKIKSVADNAAKTETVSYKMAPSFIKRMVRRRKDKIEFSEIFTTKDGVRVRIKPLLITTTKCSGPVQTDIRKKTKALIAAKVTRLDFDPLIEEIISYKFQMFLRNNLKKLHPLRNCEIRVFAIEKSLKNKE